jgi:hypothetical protein
MIGRPFCFVFGKKTLDSILMVTFSLKSAKASLSIIRKESHEQRIRGILFGMAGLLMARKKTITIKI